MTKKHFEALAAALFEAREHTGHNASWDDGVDAQWLKDVAVVADVCATTNPRFDRARFLAACGVEESK